MSWVKLTDGFPEDPRVAHLSHKAFRLYVTGLCYSARNLTDGHISTKGLKVTAASADVQPKVSTELVEAGLWSQNGSGGYVIQRYLDYNPSAAEVREQRKKRSDAGRLGGLASGRTRSKQGSKR